MANSKLPTDQQAALISISSQGILLRGIAIRPAATYKAQKGPFDNSFSNNLSLFQLLQIILAMEGFPFVIKSVLLKREHR